jgi:hypothetical protein
LGTGGLQPRPTEDFTKLHMGELERRGGVRGGVDARTCLPRPSGTGGLQRPGEDGGDAGVGGLQRRSREV